MGVKKVNVLNKDANSGSFMTISLCFKIKFLSLDCSNFLS